MGKPKTPIELAFNSTIVKEFLKEEIVKLKLKPQEIGILHKALIKALSRQALEKSHKEILTKVHNKGIFFMTLKEKVKEAMPKHEKPIEKPIELALKSNLMKKFIFEKASKLGLNIYKAGLLRRAIIRKKTGLPLAKAHEEILALLPNKAKFFEKIEVKAKTILNYPNHLPQTYKPRFGLKKRKGPMKLRRLR